MTSLETKRSHVFPAVCIADGIMCEVNCVNFSPYAAIKPNQSTVSCFIREFFPFLSFTCTLDGGLLCEASEGQCSCNCVRTASVGAVLLMGQMQEERKITLREYLHFNDFFSHYVHEQSIDSMQVGSMNSQKQQTY